MDQMKNERFIILLDSLAGIGLAIETILSGWEYWAPLLIIIGTLSLWVVHIKGKFDYNVRKNAYFIYAMIAVFFHGAHETSLFDIALVIVFAMIAYSVFNEPYMIRGIFILFFVLLGMHIYLSIQHDHIFSDFLTVSRVVLHMLIVIMAYFCCKKNIEDRLEMIQAEEDKNDRIEDVDADMEDFLTNISHELRTPVNVVNGMSEMLIKKSVGSEAVAIKSAGIRLAYQIEDIQDYTECKRDKIILEEDEYMSTSLINDVVTGFRLLENDKKLELIVDLDPMAPTRMRGDVKKLHKIFRHLLENAVKFTTKGGIYLKMFTENTDYGVNLCIEMTDTGVGMDRWAIASVTKGMYQANKKRNRSSGGIGLGLFIVYGFAHKMGGFVKIESERSLGTTVRVTIPQRVVDKKPCLSLSKDFSGDILFHNRSDKYKVPRVREFYRSMATNLATGIRVHLYSAESIKEIESLYNKLNISIIFMGQEEYEADSEYFDEISSTDVVVAVSADPGFKPNSGSNVLIMPKPLYAYPVIKIINEGRNAGDLTFLGKENKPVFRNVKALVVDDEPMNLVVATELFKEYEIQTDTAYSGKEAIRKFSNSDYDVVFMDHMMPEMDGVEAMKRIKILASEMKKEVIVIALTANAVSGAREMFMKEGFDGFIAKPINIADFERVMLRELPKSYKEKGGYVE